MITEIQVILRIIKCVRHNMYLKNKMILMLIDRFSILTISFLHLMTFLKRRELLPLFLQTCLFRFIFKLKKCWDLLLPYPLDLKDIIGKLQISSKEFGIPKEFFYKKLQWKDRVRPFINTSLLIQGIKFNSFILTTLKRFKF